MVALWKSFNLSHHAQMLHVHFLLLKVMTNGCWTTFSQEKSSFYNLGMTAKWQCISVYLIQGMISDQGDSGFIVGISIGKYVFTCGLWWIFSLIYTSIQTPQARRRSTNAFYILIIIFKISTSYT